MEMINQGDNMSVTPENIKKAAYTVSLHYNTDFNITDADISKGVTEVKKLLGVPLYEGWLDYTIKQAIIGYLPLPGTVPSYA